MHGLREFWTQFRSDRMALVGLGILTAMIVMAVAAPLAPYGPFTQTNDLLKPPSSQYWLGTDNLGRDIFSRVLWGGRVSLIFGVVAAGVSLVIGVTLGSIPGYYGGLVDDAFSRFFEVFLMIPALFLMILIVAIFGSNIYFTMVIVGLTIWPSNAKITRAQVMAVKHRGYVHTAKAAGASDLAILVGHVIPNGIYPVVANSTLQIAAAVIFEASLSFLGLGDPNQVSWGQVLKSGQMYLTSGWWIALFSGVAISALVFAFNLIGDGINYSLNPRLRQREA
ncbi:MAG: ABC transporter permease [Chloroflexi bacterium]|nr:ABC transporter permease [Chloroflexota bacterium]